MDNKLTRYIDHLKARLNRRRERIARYIELKRLSRIRKYSIPKYIHCKNCGEKLLGMYCHKCGQYALDVNQPFWKYINNFLENAYQFDGKVLQTLRFLFTRPGFLSKEFVLGRINSYVHPLKLYMFASIIFFSFVLTIYSDEHYSNKVADVLVDVNGKDDSLKRAGNVIDTLELSVKDDLKPVTLSSKSSKSSKSSVKDSKYSGVTEYKEKINKLYGGVFNGMTKYLPLLIMLLMPLYAYILYKSNKKRKKAYIESFVFSIHIHTLFLILVTIVTLPLPYNVVWWVVKIFVPLFFIYNIIATKVFYERGWIASILKSMLSMLVYGTILIICLLVVMVVLIVRVADTL